MYENNRDEINFHKFLKSIRKSQGVTLEKTTFGVCTKSGMSRVESGSRLPQKLVRDRLTARLGISGEEYEEYLLPDEYRQWELRMEIIRCINKKDVEGAEEKITRYAKAYQRNRVERQFVYTMKFMVYQLKGCSENVLRKQIHDALVCTVPNIDAAFNGVQLLADQELNLIMEYVRLAEAPEGLAMTPTEWRLKEYHNIVTYVENSRMDKIAQAKVYSKVACFIADLILKEYANEESLRYALELCNRSIEVLRDTVRLYYFVELNEYRMKLIEKLFSYVDEKLAKDIMNQEVDVIALINFDESETEADRIVFDLKSLKKLYQISKVWTELFQEMYTENGMPINMENFTYLYTETECNNAVEVIRKRRAMMGVARGKLSHACSERTLQRIELEKNNPSMATVREIFEKIGLCAEYKRTRVITSNSEAIRLADELIIKLNDQETGDAKWLYEELIKKLNMDIPQNEQEMRRFEIVLISLQRELCEEDLKEMLIDTIECTLAITSLKKTKEMYLTREELSCIKDFAEYTSGEMACFCRDIMKEICMEMLDKDIEASRLCVYELLMLRTASQIGNNGEYDESNMICNKLLKESLRNKKMDVLTECIYNNLWNYQQQAQKIGQVIDVHIVVNSVNRAFLFANIARRTGWKNFLQQRFKDIIFKNE